MNFVFHVLSVSSKETEKFDIDQQVIEDLSEVLKNETVFKNCA